MDYLVIPVVGNNLCLGTLPISQGQLMLVFFSLQLLVHHLSLQVGVKKYGLRSPLHR